MPFASSPLGIKYSVKAPVGSAAEAVPAAPQDSAAAIEAGIARRPQIPAIGH
jgi:hypothetical protein